VPESSARSFTLPNRNFDTGDAIRRGHYTLVDRAYGSLLARLRERHFVNVPSALRANVLAFYGDAPAATAGHAKDARRLAADLAALKQSP
jgi:hypothetical protein